MIWTIGHGTVAAAAFAELLRSAGIETLVDVRRFPGSRRHPHFAHDEMAQWLPTNGISYRWMEDLGGRRRGSASSPHVVLRNEQFRAYAEHMSSEAFVHSIDELLEVADASPTAVMCSESVWWRCHRRLLADHLVLVEDVEVVHLFHDGRSAAHPVMEGARREGGAVMYDGT